MSKILSVLVLIALAFGVVSAQESSEQTITEGEVFVGTPVTSAITLRDQDIFLTQSNAQTVTNGPVACSYTGSWTSDNKYWRVYDLSQYPQVTGELVINRVQFGVSVVEIGNAPFLSIPVEVNLFTLNGTELLEGNLTPIASTIVEVTEADAFTLIEAPIEVTVPNTAKVVVQITTEDYGPGGVKFRVGGNTAGETAPSYVTLDCGLGGEPLNYDSFSTTYGHVINLVGDLRTFSLLSPSNGLAVAEVSSVTAITWEEYTGATSYDFTLNRPTAAAVTLNGLTPAQDTDPLTCAGGECVLTVDGAALLTEEGEYSWTVNAMANSMSVSADNDPRAFVVDFAPLPFNVISPTDGVVVTDPTTIGAVTWNRAVNAAEYFFVLTKTSTNPRDLDLGTVLAFYVSDANAEVCNTTNNICSVTLNANEIAALTTGEYFWSVYAYNESGYEVQATNAPYGFSVITGETELVENGNFEALNATGGTLLSPWKGVRRSGDKIRCNTDTVTDVAHAGQCAFVFKGSATENSLFIQNLKPNLFVTGANVNLSAWVKSQNAANKLVQLVLIFEPQDGQPVAPQKLRLDAAAGTTAYTELTATGVVGEGTVKKAKLKLQFKGAAGRTYIDDVSVVVTGTTTTPPASAPVSQGLLPLPRAQR